MEKKKKLRIGQKVRSAAKVLDYDDDGTRKKVVRTRKGEINGIYRHIFRVRWEKGGWCECFPLAAAEKKVDGVIDLQAQKRKAE